MRNHCCENDFDLHENEHVGGTHFHTNGLALRLVFAQRQKGTQKWPVTVSFLVGQLGFRQELDVTLPYVTSPHLSSVTSFFAEFCLVCYR